MSIRSTLLLCILGYFFKCPVLFSSEIQPVHVTVRNTVNSGPISSTPEVRVLLIENTSQMTLVSHNRFTLTGEHKNVTVKPGKLALSIQNGSIICAAHEKSASFGETVFITQPSNSVITLQGTNYRGSLKVFANTNGTLSILNILPVEEYLRGVVPLEIGEKRPNDSAAVQAQAVAARTYTYRKMKERKNCAYDLYATVADQVYGGESAEFAGTDCAIRSTEGIVMTYEGECIEAYYHSTCAGHTAAKHEVWGGPQVPYLVSRSDLSESGKPYCSISPRLSWTEIWKLPDFNRIINQFSRETVGQNSFRGNLNSVIVTGKSGSGRVKQCTVTGDTDIENFGGDKIRFVFRRPVAGNPILYSSNFSICRFGNEVVAYGRGYGHGVGMCQMGAIGRAREGQSFKTILLSYYSGITIEKIRNFN